MVEKLILIDASGYPSKSKSTPLGFELAKLRFFKGIFTYITPKQVAKLSIKNVYFDQSKVTDSIVDRYFDLMLREGNRRALIDLIATGIDTTTYHKIASIQQPTLVLWGDQDMLIPVEFAYRFQKDLPNDTLVVLKNVGHVPMEEAPLKEFRSGTFIFGKLLNSITISRFN